jgi:UDP-glucose 4-epimerase
MIDTWMARGVDKFIFSSTAATYGEPQEIPIPEDHPTQPINPYGRSKRAVEWYLEDLYYSHDLKSICLRYFNAAGAGDRVGEDHDPETHLIPLILQVAGGQREKIDIYGTDYDTHDGTCLRDFVHVKDLAAGHLLAKEKLGEIGCERINLGTKTGHTVKEVIEAARQVTGEKIPATPCKRRPGDPARLVADNEKAKNLLGWEPDRNLKETISDAWRWKQANPEGYS